MTEDIKYKKILYILVFKKIVYKVRIKHKLSTIYL